MERMNNAELYETDFNCWVHQQIGLIKAAKTNELDWEHLLAELEDMGKSNLRELESRFIVLIAHLLKWQFQLATLTAQWSEYTGKSWRLTIIEQRTQIAYLLKKVPSLKRELTNAITNTYVEAVSFAAEESGLPKAIFPITCPYTIEQLLDKQFYPKNS
jgi:hypothetical protein